MHKITYRKIAAVKFLDPIIKESRIKNLNKQNTTRKDLIQFLNILHRRNFFSTLFVYTPIYQ